jgi:O-antigen/teichoic acid export membrane protein
MGLLRNVAGVLLTSAAAVPIGVASGILLTRWLSVADRGFYALLTTFAIVVYQLTQLGWAEAVIYRTRRHGVSARTAFSTGLLANGGIALLAMLVCLALRESISHAFLGDVWASAFVLAALAAPLLTLGDLLRGVARALDRFDIQNGYGLLQSIGTLLGLVVALPLLGGALDAALVAYLAVQLGLVAVFGIWLAALVGFEPRVDRGEARASVAYGSNLYVQNLLISLHERVDLFLLASLGVAAFDIGLYATAASVVAQLRLVPGAIGVAILPQLAGATDAEAARLTAAVIRPSALLMVATAAALAPIGAVAIPLLFGADYAAAVRPFLLLLPGVAAVAVSRVLARYFAAINRLRGMLVLGASVLVLNVLLNLALIPRFGIAGAAVASLVSYSTEAIALVAMFLAASGQTPREALFFRASDFTPYLEPLRRRLGR